MIETSQPADPAPQIRGVKPRTSLGRPAARGVREAETEGNARGRVPLPAGLATAGRDIQRLYLSYLVRYQHSFTNLSEMKQRSRNLTQDF